MELLIVLGAAVALDVVAYFFGADSRDLGSFSRYDRREAASRSADLAREHVRV